MVKRRDDEDENDLLENDIELEDEDKDEPDDDSKDEKEIEVEIESDENEKDERIEVQGRKSKDEETVEEKRARRRRERQLKNSRNATNARQVEQLRRENAEIKKSLDELRKAAGDFGKREASRDEQQIDTAINSQKNLYASAQAQFNKAITEGDGAAAVQAQSIMTDANNKYTQLIALKNETQHRRTTEVEKTPEPERKDDRLKQAYINRFLVKHDWFDISGADSDSKRAKKIDAEIEKEGFDPNTKEYWDELDERLREELPHIFDGKASRKDTKPRPKQVNGSMGADSGSSNTKPTLKIPERVINMAKSVGQWDDLEKRKIFIRNWKEQNGSGAKNGR